MSSHLGPVASAFLDEDLDHGRRDQVLAHLAHCMDCRADLEVQRGLRAALRDMPGPALPGLLSDRLLAVGGLEPTPSCARPARTRRPSRHRRGVRRAAVSGALLALGIGGTLGLAGPPPGGPVAPVDPASTQFVRDHSSTATEVPFDEPDVMSASLETAP